MMASCLRRRLAVVTLSLAAGGLGVAAAQQGGTESSNLASPSARAASPTDRLRDGERILAHAQLLRTTITTRIEAATGRSDIVMVDCLTPLITQLEATLVSAEQRVRALRLLSNGGDDAAAAHEYTMLSVMGQRFQVIEADMNQCLGDSDITAGDDRVTVEMTIDLPEENPNDPVPPPPDVAVPFIPPPLSPAM